MTTSVPPSPVPDSPVPALPRVRIEAVELVRVALPLVVPFTTSFGRQTEREVLLVRVRTPDADGWGECVTPAAPVYSSEFTDGAALVLRDHLVPAMLRRSAVERSGPTDTPGEGSGRPTRTGGDVEVAAQDLDGLLGGFHGHRMARAALEVAVLDAQLRTAGVSLARHLGAVTDRVPAGVSVGIPDGGTPELLEQVAGYLEEGYLRIKAKVTPGTDVTPMTALRERFGDELALQVDANAAYDPDDPGHRADLDALDELGLTMIEQPFAPGRLLDHAAAASRWSTPVCLDESITDAVVTRDAIALGATSIVNIKLGRVGGVLESVRIRDVARAHRVPVWCGGMLETGVGRAANVALAALDGFAFPGDTSASARYWAHDLTEPFVLRDGHLDVPDGPGLGRAPRDEGLRSARVERLLAPAR